MRKRIYIGLIHLLLFLAVFAGVRAEGNVFDGASWNTGFITGEQTVAPAPADTPSPQVTQAPMDAVDQPSTPAIQDYEGETPPRATYRYLTGSPSSEVPLYYTSTDNKINTRLSRGTLVLVHEYANGRARITFGGWNGWVAVSSLSEKDPGTGERVGYRYAYDESGSVPLYRYGFEYAIAYIPSGAKVAITDMKENGYTYVMHGAVFGWAKNSSLRSKLPEGTVSQEGDSYYYRALVADVPGGKVQLYSDGSCGDFSKCGTLPEGTVVKVLSTQLNVRISYGGQEYYVKPRNIFREIGGGTSGSISTGVTVPVPVPEVESPEVTDSVDDSHDSVTESSGVVRGTSSSRQTGMTQRITVEIKYLGVLETCIRDASGERIVLTTELEFETEAPAGKRIAYIYAPKTAKCSMWKKASKKSELITKCKAGTVVMVLEYGREFCRIRYNGKEGYVLTSCLRFPGKNVAAIGTGKISYNGKATGSTTVNIRGAGSSSAHKIAEWRTGTEVTVFGYKDGWYEVEYRGIHGWVQEKYLTLDE